MVIVPLSMHSESNHVEHMRIMRVSYGTMNSLRLLARLHG
jgi:hypothetical protein